MSQPKAGKTLELKEHLYRYLHLSHPKKTMWIQTSNLSDGRLCGCVAPLNQFLRVCS